MNKTPIEESPHYKRLVELLKNDPTLMSRTTEALESGELEEITAMAENQTTIRLTPELLERAEALVPKIANDPELATFGRVTRAAVLRLALLRGLKDLEEKYPDADEPRSKRKK